MKDQDQDQNQNENYVAFLNAKNLSSVGAYLRNYRLTKNLSLEEVVKGTRINKVFLKALEDDDYKILPEKTYALGYLRIYANFLELSDVEQLVEAFAQCYKLRDANYHDQLEGAEYKYKKVKNPAKSNDYSTRITGNISDGWSLVVFILVSVIVALAVFIILSKDKEMQAGDPVVPERQSDLQDFLGDHEVIVVDNGEAAAANQLHNTDNLVDEGILEQEIQSIQPDSQDIEELVVLTPWPFYDQSGSIILRFTGRVWIRIYEFDQPDIIYLDRIFFNGQSYDVPDLDGLAIDVGNSHDIEFQVGDEILQWQEGDPVVIRSIRLDPVYLLEDISS